MSRRRVRIGVVGTGGLGQHHARLVAELEEAEAVGVFDVRPERAEEVGARHGLAVHPSLEALAAECEAVVLAVPTSAHAELTCELLDRGLHVLVEKPMAVTLDEADRMLAAAGDRVLAVGHVEFYNPAVQALLRLDAAPRFLEIQRLGTFSPRSLDVDVILDLMIHDLQILHALDRSPVAEVRVTGIPVLSDRVDIANARVELRSGCVANLTASRVSWERIRKLRAFLPSRYFSVDYQRQEVRGFELVESAEGREIRKADLEVVRAEPLRRELEAFLAACRSEDAVYVDGVQGRRALETALQVARQAGESGLVS